ncbi:oxygen-dependent tRNA uridine(34) hydroxylase TrhO [Pararhizobium haloflavum]|uniref:oxygen-dependent tRNA uridine(34) hydroxylase TrhO n=1 Tax=Pararhizobium haloflavum TaxID=2037914 RepID=UPI000C1807AD|nr:rhodanese-related sulfurtransferase [Pararhizobium haloflavum]
MTDTDQKIGEADENGEDTVLVAALYHFVSFARYAAFREPLEARCRTQQVKGTLLLAHEGINGTIAGPPAGIRNVLAYLREQPEFSDLIHKESWARQMPFLRLKVRLKKEIVTMGVPDIDPANDAGTYVEPAEWNKLIADPNTIVIDTRNDYEVAIGSFRGALDPQTKSFRDFPDWVRAHPELAENKKIAMFCTGGIRCEKASAFMKKTGFDEVYHLKGGILKYLEDVPEQNSLWDGECFVFDERVSVGHGLKQGELLLCRACRHPLTTEDRASERFEAGVSCPHCFDHRTEDDRRRFRERERQIALAKKRGERHLGD